MYKEQNLLLVDQINSVLSLMTIDKDVSIETEEGQVVFVKLDELSATCLFRDSRGVLFYPWATKVTLRDMRLSLDDIRINGSTKIRDTVLMKTLLMIYRALRKI